MARRVSPYVATRGRTSLVDRLLASKATDRSKAETSKQKKKLASEYREEVRALYKKAKDSGGSIDLFGLDIDTDILKAAGLAATIFGGPLAAGLTNALITGATGAQQRRASRKLLGLDEGRWANTFLADEALGYMDKAEEQQISSGKVLQDALIAGGMAAATSGSIGGKQGLGARITDARKLAQAGGDVSQFASGTIPKDTMIKQGIRTGKKMGEYTFKDPAFLKTGVKPAVLDPTGKVKTPAQVGTPRYAKGISPAEAGWQSMKGSFADMFT